MPLEPEGRTRIDRHEFIDAIAENEAAVEHRDFRFFDRHEFAVKEHCHWSASLTLSTASVYPTLVRRYRPPRPIPGPSPGTLRAASHRALRASGQRAGPG